MPILRKASSTGSWGPRSRTDFILFMSTNTEDIAAEPWIEVVRRKVSAIRFGSVQITVHDGHVTQVEAVEKTRFLPEKPGNDRGRKPH